MQPPRRSSSLAISQEPGGSQQPPPVVLEFLSPSTAMVEMPVPRAARGLIWVVASMFAAWVAALGLIHIDRVITAAGRVVSKAPTIVVQPLDTAIVRSIEVREGQEVRSGDLLARLDPTFAVADVDALQARVASFRAEVSRLQAELEERPFGYSGPDSQLTLQAAIYAQRSSERAAKLESYRQKIDSLKSAVLRSIADVGAFEERLEVAKDVEAMRRKLEVMQAGSRLNTLVATDNRIETERNLSTATRTNESVKADLAAMVAERDAYIQDWQAQAAQALSDASRQLSDAQESLNKAMLHRQLVELRADRDAIVLTVAKISVGSVLQGGEQLITLVPLEAPLEIEANVSGRDSGFVTVGDPAVIKFDTFPFSQYGMAGGTVMSISPDSFTASDQQAGRTVGAVPVPLTSVTPFYRSRIAIDTVGLRGVPANFRLTPGMPVTVDIKIGRHTVLGYLLGRVLSVASEGMREP
jgi:membrane fusion protein, hemolysin D